MRWKQEVNFCIYLASNEDICLLIGLVCIIIKLLIDDFSSSHQTAVTSGVVGIRLASYPLKFQACSR